MLSKVAGDRLGGPLGIFCFPPLPLLAVVVLLLPLQRLQTMFYYFNRPTGVMYHARNGLLCRNSFIRRLPKSLLQVSSAADAAAAAVASAAAAAAAAIAAADAAAAAW